MGAIARKHEEVGNIDIDLAKGRIKRIFKFLQELHRIKTPPVVTMKERDWLVPLDSLPSSPCLKRGFTPHHLVEDPKESARGDYILKVIRPKETQCPSPSVVLKNWLKPGWEIARTYSQSICRGSIKSGGKSIAFDADESRVEAYEDWIIQRDAWVEKEKKVLKAMDTFSNFFELHGKFERESEKYQLYLADGILGMDHEKGVVHHPLLLQKVHLNFNPAVPEFTLVDSEDNPEIYIPLLRYVGIEGKGVQYIRDLLNEGHFHPLDAHSTSKFFKDLVQKFWKKGEFFESQPPSETRTPYIYRNPHLYIGNRNQGFGENVQGFIDGVDSLTEIPQSLLRLVGIDVGGSVGKEEDATERPDVLLTKAANPEQKKVISRLEETGAVLVQGPPGTGKSHTIANLIGHLLAQKKSILVTSHATKALEIVREKVAPPLQSLCVSLLQSDEESQKQLEESVTGIINYLSTTTVKKLEKEIQKYSEKREQLKAEFSEVELEMDRTVGDEYHEFEIHGEKISLVEAARKMEELRQDCDWIPGSISETDSMPLTSEEVAELYRLNAGLTREDETMLVESLPDLSSLPEPKVFAESFDSIGKLEKRNMKEGVEYWTHEDQSEESLKNLFSQLTKAIETVQDNKKWIVDAFDSGKAGDERKDSWIEFAKLVETCVTTIPKHEALILKFGPQVHLDRPTGELIAVTETILNHLNSGKKLMKISQLMHPGWKELIDGSEVDGLPPKKPEHFEAILSYFRVTQLRTGLSKRWERQMVPFGAPSFEELGARPEGKAKEYVEEIMLALQWHSHVWAPCETQIKEMGLDWKRLKKKTGVKDLAPDELAMSCAIITEHLEPLIVSRMRFQQWKGLKDLPASWVLKLEGYSRKEKTYPLIKQMRTAVKKANYDLYSEAWKKFEELREMVPDFEQRENLIATLEPVAKDWVKAIKAHKEPHHQGTAPGDVDMAWRYRQWDGLLNTKEQGDLNKLQAKLNSLNEKLQEVTAKYVEKLSWLAQVQRTGLKQQQSLHGWVALHKKMGKGTGKNVGRLKEEAKKTLVECRNAVPVWIMPLSRVVESFDINSTQFDVVILDEASQSDVRGLVAFAIAKEVVVVGDHEQVSPYAVGQKMDDINSLIDEFLKDIPNKQLYDGKTSVYDLARQSFGGTIRLLEHFRCVPDIIRFSNHLCYNGEVRALREASSSRVKPHLVSHRVKDGVDKNGINRNEALELVSLVLAVCKLDEYKGCTIGVISMVGTDQALYVDSILRKRLTVSEYQKRKILCGNASQFQGDERDIIFLSMVNSPGDSQLAIKQRDDVKKSFNVAASRARDQLWVVHSLDPQRDLKHDNEIK